MSYERPYDPQDPVVYMDEKPVNPWMLLKHRMYKRHIRIDNGRLQRLGVLEAFGFNRVAYGVLVDIQAWAMVAIFQCSA